MSLYEDILTKFISVGLQRIIVERLIEEYKEIRKESLLSDAEEVALHSGRFSDLILALVMNYVSGTDINIDEIHTEELINSLEQMPKNNSSESILTLAIPRVVKSIHSIRNKKDVAHVKTVDPDFYDIYYCESACNWLFSQIVNLIYGADIDESGRIINSLCEKRIPWIEKFDDGSYLLLIRDMNIIDKSLVVLYKFYPKRKNIDEILSILDYGNRKYLSSQLEKLKENKEIHINETGIVLTALGLRKAEVLLTSINYFI